MALEKKEEWKTIADVEALPEGTRAELIDGEIFYNMALIVIVCVGFHFGLLRIQRVAVYLHSGGNSGIGVNFYLFFLHLNLPHVALIPKLDWSFLTWSRSIILLFRFRLSRFSQLFDGLQIFFLHGGKSLCLIAFIFRFCFFHRLCMTDFPCMGQYFFTGCLLYTSCISSGGAYTSVIRRSSHGSNWGSVFRSAKYSGGAYALVVNSFSSEIGRAHV